MTEPREVQPTVVQSLLLQVLSQLSEVDGRLGVMQGQNSEIIREQQRAADSRKEVYEQLRELPAIKAQLARISPLVDAHETKHNRAEGALSLGKVVLAGSGGMFGALTALLAKWFLEGGHH
jgi:hypothetical protein